jgi:protein gp37
MADNSGIEWTDATWNPIRARNLATGRVGWHCVHVSEGCRYCYAEDFNLRLGTRVEFKPQLVGRDIELFLDETMLTLPLRWPRPRKIFVGSMSDLFGEFVPDAWIDHVFGVMALASQHTFQVLTKRPERLFDYLSALLAGDRRLPLAEVELEHPNGQRPLTDLIDFGVWSRPLPNVWIGTSTEDQPTTDARVPIILRTPAAVRFVSAGPLLGPVDIAWALSRNPVEIAAGFQLRGHFAPDAETLRGLDLVIAEGESGLNGRPMHPDWPRRLRDDCAAARRAFFFKQWGAWAPALANCGPGDGLVARVGKRRAGRLLDGREHNALPGLADA